jgi:hypothetical protein
VSYCFRARVTVDATAVTSAGSTVSHYKRERKLTKSLFIEPESNESVVAYYSLPQH